MIDQVFKAIYALEEVYVETHDDPMNPILADSFISLLFWVIFQNKPTNTTCQIYMNRGLDTPLSNCLSVVVDESGFITDWYYGKSRPHKAKALRSLQQATCIEDLCSVINKMRGTNLLSRL